MKKFILFLMYAIVAINICIGIYVLLAPKEKPVTKTVNRSVPAPVIAKEPVKVIETTLPAADTMKKVPVTAAITAVAVQAYPAKIAITPPRRVIMPSPEVMPPDESDASLLTTGKSNKPAVKKLTAKTDDTILQDGGAATGFNTGIKKDKNKN